ncbi:MAG: low molecular weight protein arginine phosphatase [Bacillota bacterium]
MRILFICTGNTCRSSMAVALFKRILEEKGLSCQVEVRSAGVAAEAGAPASRLAQEALREVDIDLSDHRAMRINEQLIGWADLILTMTRRQREAVIAAFPSSREKVHVLKEYLTSVSDRESQEQTLYQLHQQMAEKRERFAQRLHPNIQQLRQRRAELLQELQEVEELLAVRQAELLEELRPERDAVERIEHWRSAVDVLDPFGQPLAAYRECRDELLGSLQELAQRLLDSPEE